MFGRKNKNTQYVDFFYARTTLWNPRPRPLLSSHDEIG